MRSRKGTNKPMNLFVNNYTVKEDKAAEIGIAETEIYTPQKICSTIEYS